MPYAVRIISVNNIVQPHFLNATQYITGNSNKSVFLISM